MTNNAKQFIAGFTAWVNYAPYREEAGDLWCCGWREAAALFERGGKTGVERMLNRPTVGNAIDAWCDFSTR